MRYNGTEGDLMIKVSVTEMVNYVYMHGDLSSQTFQNNRQLEGIKAHQLIQKNYGSDKQKEVVITFLDTFKGTPFLIEGRMDGLMSLTSIEEIKSTMSLDFLFEPEITHLAQLKLYAYMYIINENLDSIDGVLTYISIVDYKTKAFYYTFTKEDLKKFYDHTKEVFLGWLLMIEEKETLFFNSLACITFPFPNYRKGQRAFMKGIFHTVNQKDLLYAVAPTGIGKTLASLFSTLKTLKDPNEKIFYLTAKTEAKQVAYEATKLLEANGLKAKTLILTSKDAICFLPVRNCDPVACPFSKGFFDRLTDALKDIYEHESIFDRETIESYAKKHMVCPFEFSLEVSNISNIIICDYNYAFDPRARLIRYFEDDKYNPILLIDEAHNLVARSKEMYSASLNKSDLINLRKYTRKIKPSVTNSVNKLINHFVNYEVIGFSEYDKPSKDLTDLISNLLRKMQKSMDSISKDSRKSLIMDEYFKLLQFEKIYELYGVNYKTNVVTSDTDTTITLRCLDASKFLKETFKEKAHGSVLFSATLMPLEYYKTLLSNDLGEHIMIENPFDKERLKVINYPIDTRYQNRIYTVKEILKMVDTLTASKKGNYICFLPSYQYLDLVTKEIEADRDYKYYIQTKSDQSNKADILDEFTQIKPYSQVAFFVLGGMFSEGIDYVGDMLNGVIVVGVGLPAFNSETEQQKAYYEETFNKGFDYAYTYPGLNKVIQAVGRVIRRDSDYGVAILMDDRYQSYRYTKLIPKHWKPIETHYDFLRVKESLDGFWKKIES